ncbi:hypothetical protein SAMN04488133_2030 [Halobellus limi]|uniref:Uncharacterized protein n=1 Tax=Halobellus limi TaxID=699433 RepID=A0A1H5ZJ66_9EURY|nr:hypothetical protein SAMN04488133_2030 [Halobellus limi]
MNLPLIDAKYQCSCWLGATEIDELPDTCPEHNEPIEKQVERAK